MRIDAVLAEGSTSCGYALEQILQTGHAPYIERLMNLWKILMLLGVGLLEAKASFLRM